jgi:hypothetical protein
MFNLISCQEHNAPTQSDVEQRCLGPFNPHYTIPLAPNLQLRTEHHDFEHHTASWPWLQLFPINRVQCHEVAREGMPQAKLKRGSLSVTMLDVGEASPELNISNDIC